MNTKISVSDIQNINGESRISSVRLAEALGHADNVYMRRTIDTWKSQLLELGTMPAVKREGSVGRPLKHYMLNERQAWIACMFVLNKGATEVRKAITEAFQQWDASAADSTVVVVNFDKPAARKRGRPAGWVPLSDEQVMQIREAHAAGEKMPALAKRYNVTATVIEKLILGTTYRHVPMSEAARVAAMELELIHSKREIRRLRNRAA